MVTKVSLLATNSEHDQHYFGRLRVWKGFRPIVGFAICGAGDGGLEWGSGAVAGYCLWRGFGHKARRRMCPLYVAGLIGPGADRKSVEPMARLASATTTSCTIFIASGVWDEAPLQEELAIQADKRIGGPNTVLVVDDTALPKKGTHSVGVAPQYASALGKTANCQTLVSLTLARDEVPAMIGLRLFLPESRTGDADRMAKARVPETSRAARTKPEIALAEIDRAASAAGVRFATVLADAGYGLSALLRQGSMRAV